MIVLRPSHIQGVGCFTDQAIRPGAAVPLIASGDCRFIAGPEVDPAERAIYESHAVSTVGGYYAPRNWLQPSLGWYLNHSRRPNLATADYGESFFTLRAIRANEELTVDYRLLDERIDNSEGLTDRRGRARPEPEKKP